MTDWLKGPEFVEWAWPWLNYSQLPASKQRAVRRWRGGAAASLVSVDWVLIDTEVSIYDIPDDLWLPFDARGGSPYSTEFRLDVARRVFSGEAKRAVARSLGADVKTVRRWVQQAGEVS